MKIAVQTILDALVSRLCEQAKRYSPTLESAPVAILWTDEKREWEGVIPKIKAVLPSLFSLGDYLPDERTGPGVWLRMVADRQAGKLAIDETPLLYLPGVANGSLRTDLRGLKDNSQLAPIAELQYRGLFWRQENSKDWTLRAFLESKRGGLGLSVAGDQDTLQTLKIAFPKLLERNLQALSGQTLDKRLLDDIINPEPADDILRWLSLPSVVQAEKGDGWLSFIATNRSRFGVDLATGPVEVVQRILASQSGDAVFPLWEKYCAHWPFYPDAYNVFKGITPHDLFVGAERYPRENEADEKRLADDLLKAVAQEPTKAANALLDLENHHGPRREMLWAKMGRSPLAVALKDLTHIATAFLAPIPGGSVAELARYYADIGWQVDASARAAMVIAQQADLEKPIYAVLETLYRCWLEKLAESFQSMVRSEGYPHWSLPDVPDGTVLLFVDGLRFDLAHELESLLVADGLAVEVAAGFTSVPSVTSSGKVWVSPVAAQAIHLTTLLMGEGSGVRGQGFEPQLPKGDYTADKLRKVMEATAYAIVDAEQPMLAYGRGWAEFSGDVDSDGHNKGIRLARAVPTHLDDLKRTLHRLLLAGWKQIWVVTDHGWLLLPGGLPKAELPAKVTETKWGRCAVLKDAVGDHDWLVMPWSYDNAVRIALAPGISAFSSGREYDHGGLSPQESVIPLLRVSCLGATVGLPQIISVKWNTRKTICTIIITPFSAVESASSRLVNTRQDAASTAEYSLSVERLGCAISEAETIAPDGKGRVIFEEVDDLLGEQVSVVLRREGQKVCEVQLNFGESWNAA